MIHLPLLARQSVNCFFLFSTLFLDSFAASEACRHGAAIHASGFPVAFAPWPCLERAGLERVDLPEWCLYPSLFAKILSTLFDLNTPCRGSLLSA
jgi:hypothetical protein